MQASISPTNGRTNGSISENFVQPLPNTLIEASQIAAQLFDGFGDSNTRSLSAQTLTTKPRPQTDEILKTVNKENFDPRKEPVLPVREKEREFLPQNTTTKKTLSQEGQDSQRENTLKRRRDEEEWERTINRKIENEREILKAGDSKKDKINKELYQLFNSLQCVASEFNSGFSCPEIVVVGMQSDGKSTFIEGLLGFQFNIVDTQMGTKRPLIIQMINDQEKREPYCRFKKERVTHPEEDPFEARDIPVSYLSEEIMKRTDAVVGQLDAVSSQPIILQVRYCQCSNLTLIDTPGYRLGGDERLLKEIEHMVTDIIKPQHRIIVCLEQATVEWANTLSRPMVRKIDADFSRTILVSTKFDNRVKELREAESTNKYLLGDSFAGKKPFFISMPLRRNLDPRRFKDEIDEAYLRDYQDLLRSKFDEDRFKGQIGFAKLKAHLESLLNQKYKESLSPTLNLLENLCNSTEQELIAVRSEVVQSDIETQKSKVYSFIGCFNLLIEKFLEGTAIGDPDKYGLTLQEERVESSGDFGTDNDFNIQNKNLKLYGGAQYERLLNEFEYVAHSIEFPATSINEVASALGTAKSHNVPLFEAAASDIVQAKAKKMLLPLISVVLRRCAFIMNHLFAISIQTIINEEPYFGIIGRYESFVNELKTRKKCEAKALDDFYAFTKILDWDLMAGLAELNDCTKDDTKKRVESIMGDNRLPQLTRQPSRSRVVDQEAYQKVLMMAGRLFSGVRYFFTKYVRAKCNAFFLDPMFQLLGRNLTEHFRKINDEQYEEMFNLGLKKMKERISVLEIQLTKYKEQRDNFKKVCSNFKKLADEASK